MSDKVFECPDTILRFNFGDSKAFSVEVSLARWTLDEMSKEAIAEFPNDEIAQDRAYSEKIRAWVEKQSKFEISLGQAEYLEAQIRDSYGEWKKKLPGSRTSPLPTSSTPASSLPMSSTPSTPISTDSTPNKSVDSDEPQPSSPQSESMT